MQIYHSPPSSDDQPLSRSLSLLLRICSKRFLVLFGMLIFHQRKEFKYSCIRDISRYDILFRILGLVLWAILPHATLNPFSIFYLVNSLKYCSQHCNSPFIFLLSFFAFKKYSNVFFLCSIRTRDLICLEIVCKMHDINL